MAGLLNIGLTGLNAAQGQLSTTSHNITNAGTPGYNRQTVVQTTLDPLFSGAGFFGQGTRITAVEREYSQFLENQVLSADNRRIEYATYAGQISQINNLLADATVGLSPAMQEFFAGVQEVAANPTSVPARQSLISTASAMVSRFQALDERITEVRNGVEGQIRVAVDSINVLADKIGEMNRQIVVAQAAGAGVPANDLLDRRNHLISELNQLIKVSTVDNGDGQVNVFVGSGQPLVLGQIVSNLGTTQAQNDPRRQDIVLVAQNGAEVLLPERVLTGGELGGLLGFRRDSLDVAQNQLGLIALSLTTEFNRIHQLGVDLDGVMGQAFFNVPAPHIMPSSGVVVGIDPAQVSQLTASDYQLSFDGTNYTIANRNTGESLSSAGPAFTFQGLTVDVTGATLAAGETALIQPTRFASRDLALAISDPRKVAAGNPVSVAAPVSNAGSGKLDNIVLLDRTGLADGPGAHFGEFRLQYAAAPANAFSVQVFDSGLNQWVAAPDLTIERYDQASGSYLPGGAYVPASIDSSGVQFRISHTDGWSFEMKASGAVAGGDVFNFAPTEVGIADNRNAVRLGALQTEKVMLGANGGVGTATFQSAYSQMVSAIGNKTREVQVGEQTQTSLLRQATDQRDALSGVNLDEEAANLIRYQQAYQASAQVMSIAQRLFDEVLGIAR